MATQYKDIDDYIKTFPPGVRTRLTEIRNCIRKAAPQATEAISYQMPTFKLNGNLVSFAAWKKHIGLYGASPALDKYKKEVAHYATEKGTLQFPLDEPLPIALIAKIVEFRAKENSAKKPKT